MLDADPNTHQSLSSIGPTAKRTPTTSRMQAHRISAIRKVIATHSRRTRRSAKTAWRQPPFRAAGNLIQQQQLDANTANQPHTIAQTLQMLSQAHVVSHGHSPWAGPTVESSSQSRYHPVVGQCLPRLRNPFTTHSLAQKPNPTARAVTAQCRGPH
jgi:hypothetical protein